MSSLVRRSVVSSARASCGVSTVRVVTDFTLRRRIPLSVPEGKSRYCHSRLDRCHGFHDEVPPHRQGDLIHGRSRIWRPLVTIEPSRFEINGMSASLTAYVAAFSLTCATAGCMASVWKAPATSRARIRAFDGE